MRGSAKPGKPFKPLPVFFEDICRMKLQRSRPFLSASMLLLTSMLVIGCAPHIREKQDGFAAMKDGSRIYYEKVGSGKQAVVLLQGPCMERSIWDSTVSELKDEYTLLRFDPAGTGRSTASSPDYSPLSIARQTLAVMNACGIRKAIFIAYGPADQIMLALCREAAKRVSGLLSIEGFLWLGTGQTAAAFDCFGFPEKKEILDCLQSGPAAAGHLRLPCPEWEEYAEHSRNTSGITEKLPVPLQIITSGMTDALEAAGDSCCPAGLILYPLKCEGRLPMLRCPLALNRELRIALASAGI